MRLSNLLESATTVKGSYDGIHFYPVRPMTRENSTWVGRLKMAWLVLTNKADAVVWDQEAAAAAASKSRVHRHILTGLSAGPPKENVTCEKLKGEPIADSNANA